MRAIYSRASSSVKLPVRVAAAVLARALRRGLRDFRAVHRDGERRGRVKRFCKGRFALVGEIDLYVRGFVIGKAERAFRHVFAGQPDLAVRVRERQLVPPCEELRHTIGFRVRRQGDDDRLPVLREGDLRPGNVQLLQTVLEHGAHLFDHSVVHLIGVVFVRRG